MSTLFDPVHVGQNYLTTPSIYTDAPEANWKKV